MLNQSSPKPNPPRVFTVCSWIICAQRYFFSGIMDKPGPSRDSRKDGPPPVPTPVCPECNNILYPKEDKPTKTLYYACRHCAYKEKAKSNCVYVNRVLREVDELKNIVPEVVSDPTLPRTDYHPCPACGHRDAVFFQSDKPNSEMRLYYVCAKCHECWTEWDTICNVN